MRLTRLDAVRLPNLKPWVSGSKLAVSCHKDKDFLIRAWGTKHSGPQKLIDWILYYVGRMNLSDLEWWGYTYIGKPLYMGEDEHIYTSGLTIQYFVEPEDRYHKKALEEGRIGPTYGPPIDLIIPDKGYIQRMHNV